MPYIKDYRLNVDNPNYPVYSYDGKFKYLHYHHPDSIFNPESDNYSGFVKLDLDLSLIASFLPITAIRFARIYKIRIIEAIAYLIQSEFTFANGKWYRPASKLEPKGSRRYVITTAVNNTRVHPGFFAIERYAIATGAELLVIPISYHSKNRRAPFVWFDPPVLPYLCDRRLILDDRVQILGDLQQTATVVNPLSGLQPLTKGMHTIAPSTKLALQSIATGKGVEAVQLWATGACTEAKYKPGKAGFKAKFHHSISAIIVEMDATNCFIRNLPVHPESKEAIDLGVGYSSQGVVSKSQKYALSLGDLHIGITDTAAFRAVCKAIAYLGKPEYLFLHDCFDGQTVNPHQRDSSFAKFERTYSSLQQELDENAEILTYLGRLCDRLVVVASNHNDFLNRWLDSVDWKELDASTAKLYLKAAAIKARGEDLSCLYAREMRERGVRAIFLQQDETFFYAGNDMGRHGDRGSNGAKGSSKSFHNAGSPTVTGHTHSPSIYLSNFTNGTLSKLWQSYMRGLSSQAHAHTIVYENSLRQLITTRGRDFQLGNS